MPWQAPEREIHFPFFLTHPVRVRYTCRLEPGGRVNGFSDTCFRNVGPIKSSHKKLAALSYHSLYRVSEKVPA